MKINPSACEYYRLRIDSSPTIPASSWQLSIDDGATWHSSTIVDGLPAWLVCGPDYAGPESAARLTESLTRPLIRAVENPETVIRRTPKIVLITPGPVG